MSTEISTAAPLASEETVQQTVEVAQPTVEVTSAGATTATEPEIQVARSPELVREATEVCGASASTGPHEGEEAIEPITRGFLSKKMHGGVIALWNKRYFVLGEEPMPIEHLYQMFKKQEKKTKPQKEPKPEGPKETGEPSDGQKDETKLEAIEEEKPKPEEPPSDEVKVLPLDEYEAANQSLFRNISTAVTSGKGLLFYYSQEKDQSPHGLINLADISSVEASPKVKNHSFTLKSSGREWVLAANSEKECQQWIKALDDQVTLAKESQVEDSDAYKDVHKRLVSKQAFEKLPVAADVAETVQTAVTEAKDAVKEKLTPPPESKRKSYFQMLTGGLKRSPKEAATEVHTEAVEDVKIKSLELGDDVNLTKEMEAATEKIVEDVKAEEIAEGAKAAEEAIASAASVAPVAPVASDAVVTTEVTQDVVKDATTESVEIVTEVKVKAEAVTDTAKEVTGEATEATTEAAVAEASKVQEAVQTETPTVAVVEEVKQSKRKSFLPSFSFKKESTAAAAEETPDVKQEILETEGTKEESKNPLSRAVTNIFKRTKKEEVKIAEEATEASDAVAEKTEQLEVASDAVASDAVASDVVAEKTEQLEVASAEAEAAPALAEAKVEQVAEAGVEAGEKEVAKAMVTVETAENTVTTEVEKAGEAAAEAPKAAEAVVEGASRRKSMLKGLLFKGKKEAEAKSEEVKEEAKDATEQVAEAVEDKKKAKFGGFSLFKSKAKETEETKEAKEEVKEETKEEAKEEGSCLRSGFLQKQSNLLKTSEKRYFSFGHDGTIKYSKDESLSSPKSFTVDRTAEIKEGKDNSFEIVTKSQTYKLTAESPEDRDAWISTINNYKSTLPEPAPESPKETTEAKEEVVETTDAPKESEVTPATAEQKTE